MGLLDAPALAANAAGRVGSGQYFYPFSPASASTSVTLGNGTLRLVPFLVPRRMTITRVGVDVATAGQSGSTYRPVFYSDNGSGYPGSLLLDVGLTASIDGFSATVQEITISLDLPRDLIWIGGVVQSAGTTQPTIRVNGLGVSPLLSMYAGTTLPPAASSLVGYSATGVSGAPPPTWSSTVAYVGTCARLILKTA